MTIETRIADHNAYVLSERARLEREVKKAIAVLGVTRVVDLCAAHADARACEACNADSRRRWRSAYRRLSSAFLWVRQD